MASPDLSLGLLTSGVLGYVVHRTVFQPYEPRSVEWLAVLLLLVPAVPTAVLLAPIGSTLLALSVAYYMYYCSIIIAAVAYRLLPTHPLAMYPGPLPCKITKLWLVYQANTGKLHEYMRRLHAKYGPVVRIGPNEISVVDVDLIPRILGSEGMPKGSLWEGRRISGKRGAGAKNNRGNLIGNRYKDRHAEARKTWNRAFTPAALKDYELILVRRVAQLVDELKNRGTAGPVDLSLWLSYCIFDFMGDMVFGGGFELMHEGDKDGIYRTMVAGLHLPALTQQIPWVAPALPYVPWIGRHMKALGQFAFKCTTKRLQEGSVTNDLLYHLLDEVPNPEKQTPFPVIMTNAVTAMLAGSDTTAVALCNAFYCVLAHPGVYQRLREELDATFPQGTEPVDAAKLASLEYLNAVINETLRLYPSIPTSLQRAPQPGTGTHQISPTFVIDERTGVLVPPYVLHRDPRYFSPDPDRFWPERWLRRDDPGIVTNASAFIPFSSGPPNCVGRPVALLSLRMVLAWMMLRFDMRLAEGYDVKQWERDLKDYFAFQKGRLPVVLRPRS
ncbi:cytochrome P450 [Daedalea quercina L-15889]|uniref:Cytochrome P450 n=1 Tax=Daedalea quercina L-15889 TaxID=1314783 RepID=A0A165MWP0_9APHY|nr:cytochrome P450 [Daedalea quercina L-15889]